MKLIIVLFPDSFLSAGPTLLHFGCTAPLNAKRQRDGVGFLYMCCLSTVDPNYLNVTLILGIQGIVQLN